MRFSLSLPLLLEVVGEASVSGEWEGELTGIADLREAGPGDLSFLGNERYEGEVPSSRASVLLLPEDFPGEPAPGQVFVRVANPSLALGRFCGEIERQFWPRPEPGIHPTAVIDRDAVVTESASVGPYCLVSAGARVGRGAVLRSHVFLGPSASIGEETRVASRVTVGEFCEVGRHCVLESGVVLGSEGFGYESSTGVHQKLPQIGRVVLGDEVEVGANTTIDRARFGETTVGEGTKIDNLVQIGHNVRIGRHCLIVAQVGISGSTTVEDSVIIGGQTGLVGHIHIGKGVRIGAQSGVSKSIPAGQFVRGAPAMEAWAHQRLLALQRRLPQLFAKVEGESKKADGGPVENPSAGRASRHPEELSRG